MLQCPIFKLANVLIKMTKEASSIIVEELEKNHYNLLFESITIYRSVGFDCIESIGLKLLLSS